MLEELHGNEGDSLSVNRPVFFLILLALVLTSCPTPRFSDSRETGSLLLFLSTHLNASTIVPPLAMTIASYNISGNGPGNASFSHTGVTAATSTFAQNDLAVGEWTISVDACNDSQDLIGSGSTTVAIEAGQIAQASVQIAPLSGTGSLALNISWTAGLISVPAVSATLTPVGGAAQSLAFTFETNSASYSSGNALSAGYYSLALQVMDGGIAVWGFFDAVRILQGQTTTAIFNLTSQDLQ